MNTLHKLTGRARSILHIFMSLSVVLLNLGPLALPAGAATPSFKQVKASTPSSPQSSVATTFAQAQTAGDLNVVVVGWNQATGTVNAVTDSKGNVYQVAAPLARGTNLSQVVYYAKNIVAATAGANTVTVTFSAAATYADVRILEYAGLDTVSPLDVTAAASGTAANASSGAVTTHAASELLIGAGTTAGAFSAAGTSFTSRIITTDDDIAEDRNVTTTGSYSATATAKGGAWVMQLVAFKAAAGTDTTAPSAPASPAATATSSTQVNLAWTASTDNVGVTGYQVERCQGSACTNFALLTTVTGTTYSNTGLAPSTLYRYRLRATDAAGNLSAYSAIVEATTQGTPDTTPPGVPTGLTGTGASISQINLSWTASTDNIAVTGYKVFRNGAQIGTSTGTSFQDTGLAVNTSYSYTVSAYDAAGNNSAQSVAVAASTLPDTTPPSVPTGLTAQVVSSTQINLSWTASTDNVGVSGYRLYRNGSLINTVTVTPVQDAGLTAGTTYSYTVSAFDAAGNASAQTAAVQATTPAPDNTPPAVSMTAPLNGTTVSGTVTFSANASDTGSGVHDVEFLLDGVTLSDDTTSPYSYAWDTTTTTNGVHHLAVRAHDNAGNFSNTSGAFTVTVNNQPSQLPVDLMAGYPFTESTGTTTADVTSYGNVASFNSLANPVWGSGKYGSGVKFDGATTSYLSVADSTTMNISGTALTLSMWINPSGSSTGDQVVFGKFWNGTGSAPHYQYGLELDRGTQPHFYIGTTSSTSVGAPMGSDLPLGQWSHLAVTFDGSHANFYLNGALVSSPSLVGSIASRTGSTIRLGNDIDGSQGFKGTLDDVRLYRRAETQADIQTDKNTPLVANGSSTGPSIAITAPTQNAQVGGIVTITADVGSSRVDLQACKLEYSIVSPK